LRALAREMKRLRRRHQEAESRTLLNDALRSLQGHPGLEFMRGWSAGCARQGAGAAARDPLREIERWVVDVVDLEPDGKLDIAGKAREILARIHNVSPEQIRKDVTAGRRFRAA
jgi:hypothetical protein